MKKAHSKRKSKKTIRKKDNKILILTAIFAISAFFLMSNVSDSPSGRFIGEDTISMQSATTIGAVVVFFIIIIGIIMHYIQKFSEKMVRHYS